MKLLALACVVLAGCGNPYYEGPKSDHFDGNAFHNYAPEKPDLFAALKWAITRKTPAWPQGQRAVPKPTLTSRVYGASVLATYIGHSTVLIQTAGLNFLLDPVWSNRASPISWAGPKRAYEIPIAIKDLPPIDVVLISHNHYDHLDIDSLRLIVAHHNPLIFTGLGLDKYLFQKGINAKGLDWWNHVEVEGSSITFVPSKHWSARWLWDRNYTLWGGFVISSAAGQIYLAGDTAYCKRCFDEIAERFNNIVLSFIPIGAYEPRDFMKHSHMSPQEAAQVAIDVRSKLSVATQFDSFVNLADEKYGAAKQDLASALTDKSRPFLTLEPMSTVQLP